MSPALRRWPAEWAPHRATWLSWPHSRETWPGAGLLEAVEDAFCEIVRAILPGEAVEINVASAEMAGHVRGRLSGAGIADLSGVHLREIPTDDAWVRDHGGIFVFEDDDRVLLDFEYDAWGGKYPPWDRDAAVARQMARAAGVPREAVDLVLEGGSIEGDGEGTILTTESCLLNPNRARPGVDRSRAAFEEMFGTRFGASRVLWLEDGVEGDDTDGHIDDLTRFVAPGRVVTGVEPAASDPNHAVLARNRARLAEMVDAQGRALEVIELPMPGAFEGPHGRAPASYANFYFANAGLLVPVFDQPTDAEAIGILEALGLDRPVLPIPAQSLVLGLGAVHCLTQQEPAPHLGGAESR
ncbi:MAG: agmatine deiminase [Deltaproteobacteria bacterium]|nr:agmatine deiminase [Deltaproteobacteria bacterium]